MGPGLYTDGHRLLILWQGQFINLNHMGIHVRLLRSCLAVVCLLLPLLAVAPSASSATESVDGTASAAASARSNAEARRAAYKPPLGAVFTNPFSNGRVIMRQVHRAIHSTPNGQFVRLVVWNYDDPAITNALLRAHERGVHVQVVVAQTTRNPQWGRLHKALARNPNDRSFARKCHGACRSKSRIMHAKIFLFSKAGTRKNITMFGSTNLTLAAGNRQWNDQTTTANEGLYDYFVERFKEYAADKPIHDAGVDYEVDDYRVTLFPRPNANPMADAFRQVTCIGADTGYGNARGRTIVRLAIAGWFDDFGTDIARAVRKLYNAGCDIRIVTTLAGRGVNRALRYGRGAVPIRQVSIDQNKDKVPEYYLHMKSVSINGVYEGDTSASVVFTGSPNWSERARNSDEVWIRIMGWRELTRSYQSQVDRLFTSKVSHPRMEALRRPQHSGSSARGSSDTPYWYELD